MLTMLYCISMVLPMFGSWTLRPIAEHHTVIRAHYNIRRINNDRKGKDVYKRQTPAITFIIDQSIEYGVEMSKKIDEVTKNLKED